MENNITRIKSSSGRISIEEEEEEDEEEEDEATEEGE
jgi:hypothetical protein